MTVAVEGQASSGQRGARGGELQGPGWATLLIVLCATFVTTLDFFIVNVAIPSITVSLHANSAQVQWAVAGFALAIACGVITGGRLGDLFGRRRMFLIGLLAFTIASALCGVSPSANYLIISRILQGLAAAVMSPQVLAIIGATYAGKARVRAFTGYGLAMGLAAVSGQLIGGALIQADIFGMGWRSCFLVNVPVGVATFLVGLRHIRESSGSRQRVDISGVVVITVALFCLVFPLIYGRSTGWPVWSWGSLVVGILGLWAFYLLMKAKATSQRPPLVDPTLFADRAFVSGSIALLFSWIGQASFFLVLSIYLQSGLKYTPMQSGEIVTVMGSGYLISSVLSPTVASRLGKQTVTVGAALMIAGLALLLWSTETMTFPTLLVGLAVDGAGMGFVLAPMASLVMAGVEPRHLGSASGVFSTINQVGGALGVTLVGIVFYATSDVIKGFGNSVWLLAGASVAVIVSIQFLPNSKRGIRS
jgi:EmrB/QacA subfamily drug resistance transporter